jgi:hypothetical protein
MRATSVFVGFLRCPPGHHDAFLDWHEEDHRPENHGTIEHIYHSARFIAPPEAVARRELGPDQRFADAGQYVMTYWSSAPPARLLEDMTVLREQLQAAGRCEPINRDFRAVWRDRLRVVEADASPLHLASPDAAPFAPHDALVVTVGRHSVDGRQGERRCGTASPMSLFEDDRFTAAFALTSTDAAERSLVVHLHYALGPPDEAQAAVRAHAQPGLEIVFRGVYVPQYAGQPRFYE